MPQRKDLILSLSKDAQPSCGSARKHPHQKSGDLRHRLVGVIENSAEIEKGVDLAVIEMKGRFIAGGAKLFCIGFALAQERIALAAKDERWRQAREIGRQDRRGAEVAMVLGVD